MPTTYCSSDASTQPCLSSCNALLAYQECDGPHQWKAPETWCPCAGCTECRVCIVWCMYINTMKRNMNTRFERHKRHWLLVQPAKSAVAKQCLVQQRPHDFVLNSVVLNLLAREALALNKYRLPDLKWAYQKRDEHHVFNCKHVRSTVIWLANMMFLLLFEFINMSAFLGRPVTLPSLLWDLKPLSCTIEEGRLVFLVLTVRIFLIFLTTVIYTWI